MTTILSFKQTARRAARVALALIAGGALLGACNKEDAPDAPDGGDRIPVTFSAGIESAAVTRTTGLDNNTWASTDHIGIVMSDAGYDIGYGEGTLGIFASNIEYAADKIDLNDKGRSRATFIPVSGKPIYYPRTGKVDFHAYYPYTKRDNKGGKLDDQYNLPVDLSDQSNPAAIDVLYAVAKSVIPSRKPVELDFNHMCAKITLNVAAGEGFTADDIRALPAADVNVKIKTAVLLQVATFGRVFVKKESPTKDVHPYKANVTPAGANAVFSVIFSPRNEKDIPVQFTIGGNTYTVNLTPKDIYNPDPGNYIPWQPGANYVYPIIVKRTGVETTGYSIEDWKEEDKGTGTVEKPDVVYIPAGTFLMGSSDGSNTGDKDSSGLDTTEAEPNRNIFETQHRVTLKKGFWMSKYEITNAQYAAFLNAVGIGKAGRFTKEEYPGGRHPDELLVADALSRPFEWGVTWSAGKWKPIAGYEEHPAIWVSWYGADEYAHWAGGALPTEAQWEYACRGGQTECLPYGIGDGSMLYGDMANFDGENPYDLSKGGWMDNYEGSGEHPNTYLGTTRAVGSYKPNGYGLYDMHGNVREWCADWYGYNYYNDPSAGVDPAGPASGSERICRGGGWFDYSHGCRSAFRGAVSPETFASHIGFRVVINE